VYLVKGDDPTLVSQALSGLIEGLVGDRALHLTLEELADDVDITTVVGAVQTPAFLTDRRVVLVRAAGRFRADEIEPIVDYLNDPMPSTSLILVSGGGAMPTRLAKAIKEKGHILDAAVPGGKGRERWLTAEISKGPVKLDRRATELIGNHLGDELGQLNGILDSLAAAYGEGARLEVVDIEPFLGAGGAAAPWELTDAIDSGDTSTALAQLRRMLEPGQRHPLVVIATLQRHVTNLLRLDGADITTEVDAARVLGIAPYPAKKALGQSRRLGSKVVLRAVRLAAEADVDLRGGSAWPPEVVLEVLVARLSKLATASTP